MCGIAGIVHADGAAVDVGMLERMSERLRHRGPDDEGYLLGEFPLGAAVAAAGHETVSPLRSQQPHVSTAARRGFSLGFGHRRLAIIDCTAAGHQPMTDAAGTSWLVYNGEIYNYIELRAELEAKGHVFQTRSDTEVILAAYAEWGRACLGRFNGMWAFCLWDRRRGELFCARDRFGVKPLYYRSDGSTFTFASEIKALLESSPESPRVNDATAYDYLAFDLLDHTPETMLAGILQLAPGHWLTFDGGGRLTVQRYYRLPYTTASGPCDEAHIARLGAEYRELLMDAVRLRLRTDVPLGSCLSGGLDSSAIVCAMNKLLGTPAGGGLGQRTVTAAYEDPRVDERRFAEQVVAVTGAQAEYTFPQTADVWDELLTLIWHQDEPGASISMYGQWCVMRAARRCGITVMLDGQGADELFAGYTTYQPIFLKELLRRGCFMEFRKELVATAARIGQSPWRLAAKAAEVLYDPLRRHLPAPPRRLALLNGELARAHRHRTWHHARPTGSLQARLWADQLRFSLPQLLRYEDRNSMAFSVETRLPFLDYRLVEWAFAQAPCVKLHRGWSKYVARVGAADLCPASIVWRTDKIGFAAPEAAWMEAGAEALRELSEPATFRAGRFIDPVKLRAALFPRDQPVPRARRELWRAANFELWMRVFGIG